VAGREEETGALREHKRPGGGGGARITISEVMRSVDELEREEKIKGWGRR